MTDIKTAGPAFPPINKNLLSEPLVSIHRLRPGQKARQKKPSRVQRAPSVGLTVALGPVSSVAAAHAGARRVFKRCSAAMRRSLLLLLFGCAAPLLLQPAVVLAQTESAESGGAATLVQKDVPAVVNINTASAAELSDHLNGVGGRKAEAIVRYREQFGAFESVDELSEVSGIGASTVERNRALLRTQ